MNPYANHAWQYFRAGWRGVLPLRPGTKWPPPTGFTGHQGEWPFPADIQAWTEDRPDGNIALRLPEDVLGIDVDAYDDKPGRATLAEAEALCGPLPKTVMSTSRTDGTSGIRLYRTPPFPSWPTGVGPGIELISHGHRYCVAWPSQHPDGRTYRWVDQRTGEVLDRPPSLGDLAELPTSWVEALQERSTRPADKAEVDDVAVKEWLLALRNGDPCSRVTQAAEQALQALQEGREARHDAMLAATGRLVGYGAWGHAGVSPALQQVRATFLQVVTAPGAGQRREEDAVGEWRRAISGAVAMHVEERPVPSQVCSCPLPAFDGDLEETFWRSREVLEHIRTFARARRASPWAVLGVALVRVTTAMPPHYVLPPAIGSHASINLFVGIVAPSGGGKGAAEAAAGDAVDVGKLHTSGVGSGEGILHQYVTRKRGKGGLPGGLEQHNDKVLFTAAEVDTLGALHARQASTLLSELRKVWVGEELSFAYVDPTKRLKVERHRYRAGLVVGIQPARAGVLLDDTDGGTPQRFLWMPGNDPQMPDVAPSEPPVWRWEMPTGTSMRIDGLVELDVCQEARTFIDTEHVRRNRGEGETLDAHTSLCRLKVAAGLGILDGRLGVTEADWVLSGVVMEMSRHTRDAVLTGIRAKVKASNTARALADAEREVVRDEAVTEAVIQRVCRTVMRLVDGLEVPRKHLTQSITSSDRGFLDAAISRLVGAGQLEVRTDGRATLYRPAKGRAVDSA